MSYTIHTSSPHGPVPHTEMIDTWDSDHGTITRQERVRHFGSLRLARAVAKQIIQPGSFILIKDQDGEIKETVLPSLTESRGIMYSIQWINSGRVSMHTTTRLKDVRAFLAEARSQERVWPKLIKIVYRKRHALGWSDWTILDETRSVASQVK